MKTLLKLCALATVALSLRADITPGDRLTRGSVSVIISKIDFSKLGAPFVLVPKSVEVLVESSNLSTIAYRITLTYLDLDGARQTISDVAAAQEGNKVGLVLFPVGEVGAILSCEITELPPGALTRFE